MRDKIIQYLQDIKCEWFPVEWDAFFSEYIKMAEGDAASSSAKQMKYRFHEKTAYHAVRDGDYGDEIALRYAFFYGSLDRCKKLLLNAVRSVDEPKRIAAGHKYFKYVMGANIEWIRIFRQSRKGGSYEIIWENGEFK